MNGRNPEGENMLELRDIAYTVKDEQTAESRIF